MFPDNSTKVFDSVPFSEESSVQAYRYRHICYLAFWHCPAQYAEQNKTVQCPSVCIFHSPTAAAAACGWFTTVGPAGRRYQSTAAAAWHAMAGKASDAVHVSICRCVTALRSFIRPSSPAISVFSSSTFTSSCSKCTQQWPTSVCSGHARTNTPYTSSSNSVDHNLEN